MCKNLIHNHGENVFLVVGFQNFVGAWAPISYYVASPLPATISCQQLHLATHDSSRLFPHPARRLSRSIPATPCSTPKKHITWCRSLSLSVVSLSPLCLVPNESLSQKKHVILEHKKLSIATTKKYTATLKKYVFQHWIISTVTCNIKKHVLQHRKISTATKNVLHKKKLLQHLKQ